jgi:hypothetical protein
MKTAVCLLVIVLLSAMSQAVIYVDADYSAGACVQDLD